MKKYIFWILLMAILGGGLYLYSSTKAPVEVITSSKTADLVSPARLAEVNGYILSVEGNEIVVANEKGVKEITEEERVRRQKLTQEERQALKAQESANLTKENISITIPVGISIVKGSGDASGSNIKAEMSEMTKGIYISIWKNGDSIEFVKLKGVAQ
jgi:hypothetical protein